MRTSRQTAPNDVKATPPLARAFAHGDCAHARPLLDALENRFCALEADIWLQDGALLVGHDFEDLIPGRTLETLYLEPLLERIRQNRGYVYPAWPHSVLLLVDVKSEAETTYSALHDALEKYADIFTSCVHGAVHEKALTALISGNRARKTMESQDARLAFYDGRMTDLNDGSPASLMPVISDEWGKFFKWNGTGAMPEAERRKLHSLTQSVHAEEKRLRFWATPENGAAREAVWHALVAAGVDYINTDHLPELRDWLTAGGVA